MNRHFPAILFKQAQYTQMYVYVPDISDLHKPTMYDRVTTQFIG